MIATQYQTEIGEDLFIKGKKKAVTNLKILIENMGRVNYGHKLLADTPATKAFEQVSVWICISTFIGSNIHWI